ncbi:MAG TPA: DUF2752 domain-containing protein [Acidimicrobiales bacterium]|nr:DUF2752 domain-containing protein [Acidimicrobiales bacterium]
MSSGRPGPAHADAPATGHVHGPTCHAAPPPPTRARLTASRSSAATLLALLTGLSALVLVRSPLENTVFPPCPLHATTGLWCPGCGATRASYLVLKGDVIGALHFNALWVVLAPFALYQAVAFAGEAFGVGWLRRVTLTRPLTIGILASMAVFFVVRNLPIDAVEVLNPVTAS